MRAGKRKHLARKAADLAKALEAREAREAVARMEQLAQIERGGTASLYPATYDELLRRFPALDQAAPTIVADGTTYNLREAANAGLLYIRGDGRVVVQTLKSGSSSALSVARFPRKTRFA